MRPFVFNGKIFVENYEDLKPGVILDVISDYEESKKIEEVIDDTLWELIKEVPFE